MTKKKDTTKKVVKKKIKETPEAVIIYHKGDDIEKISKLLTGKDYLSYKLLTVNGLNMNTLKDGAVLKWEI